MIGMCVCGWPMSACEHEQEIDGDQSGHVARVERAAEDGRESAIAAFAELLGIELDCADVILEDRRAFHATTTYAWPA